MDYVLDIERCYSTAGAHLKFGNYEENCIRFFFMNKMKNICKFITFASCLLSQILLNLYMMCRRRRGGAINITYTINNLIIRSTIAQIFITTQARVQS